MVQRTAWQSGLQGAVRLGGGLNRVVEWVCAALVAAMVGIVWYGVLARYILHTGETWSGEVARYVMIWAALLAVSVGVYRREHIGVELLLGRLPPRAMYALRIVIDLIGLAFFAALAVFGVGMTLSGGEQYTPLFGGVSMMVPFLSVPVAALLSLVQMAVVLIRDYLVHDDSLPAQPMGGEA